MRYWHYALMAPGGALLHQRYWHYALMAPGGELLHQRYWHYALMAPGGVLLAPIAPRANGTWWCATPSALLAPMPLCAIPSLPYRAHQHHVQRQEV